MSGIFVVLINLIFLFAASYFYYDDIYQGHKLAISFLVAASLNIFFVIALKIKFLFLRKLTRILCFIGNFHLLFWGAIEVTVRYAGANQTMPILMTLSAGMSVFLFICRTLYIQTI